MENKSKSNSDDIHDMEEDDSSEFQDTEEDMLKVGNTVGHSMETFSEFDIRSESKQNVESFYASTPKKSYPCEQCEKGSECVDCFVVHILGRHGIARASFP